MIDAVKLAERTRGRPTHAVRATEPAPSTPSRAERNNLAIGDYGTTELQLDGLIHLLRARDRAERLKRHRRAIGRYRDAVGSIGQLRAVAGRPVPLPGVGAGHGIDRLRLHRRPA